MKVAFESSLLLGNRSGIGNYLFYLAGELCCSPEVSELFFIANRYGNHGTLPVYPNTGKAQYHKAWVPQTLSNSLAHIMWHRWYLGAYVGIKRPDIIHFPSLIGARYPHCKTVVTVHDLSFETFYPRSKQNNYYREYGLRSARLAERVIADSFATKQDLINIWGIAEDKIEVIHLGCGSEYHALERAQCARVIEQTLSVRTPYILWVGNIEPRKNLTFLLRAFEMATVRVPELNLIIAGRPGMSYPEFYKALGNSAMRKSITLVNGPSTEAIVYLYNAAACLCFPSLKEGFGLPVLEAFNCDCPVIASNNSSLPEVAGDAAVLLAATDLEGWVAAIERLVKDSVVSDAYRVKGRERAALFSWEKCARQTVEVYRSLL